MFQEKKIQIKFNLKKKTRLLFLKNYLVDINLLSYQIASGKTCDMYETIL